MEFFENPQYKNKFPEDQKIDEQIKLSPIGKEPGIEDYTDELNFSAEMEEMPEVSEKSNLRESGSDGSETIAQRIKHLKEALEYYESVPVDPKIQEKIIELKVILKRINPDSVLIDPNLN